MTNEILQSATKLVLLAMTGAMIAGLFVGKIEAKDFMTVMIAIIAFYFGQKTNVPVPETTEQLP